MDSSRDRTAPLPAPPPGLGVLQAQANQGDAGAQYTLGARCHRASLDRLRADTEESRIEAFKWYHLAAAQGFKGSLTACQLLSLGMSRAEFDEGTRRAGAFVVLKPVIPPTP